MQTYQMLILTDHATHSAKNSVYELANALRDHPKSRSVHIASRSHPDNRPFFFHNELTSLSCHKVGQEFTFESAMDQLMSETHSRSLDTFDVIFMRLPRPIPEGFFDFLESVFPREHIVNRPSGITITGSKTFLLNFKDICPPIALCQTLDDIHEFRQRFPIVLKPIENYGGKGVVKIENGIVYSENSSFTFDEYRPQFEEQITIGGYLGMKFLKNVDQGDKRVVVVNGEILGAALRMPPKDSWICNAAMGGSSSYSDVDEEERTMAERVHEEVTPYGIGIFGMDTLVGDDGLRKLSEINTLSIGGIAPMAEASGKPLVEKAADLLFKYIDNEWK